VSYSTVIGKYVTAMLYKAVSNKTSFVKRKPSQHGAVYSLASCYTVIINNQNYVKEISRLLGNIHLLKSRGPYVFFRFLYSILMVVPWLTCNSFVQKQWRLQSLNIINNWHQIYFLLNNYTFLKPTSSQTILSTEPIITVADMFLKLSIWR